MTVLTRIEGVAALETELPIGVAAGAQVRTPCGPRNVENLRPGDLIVTRRDGLQPLRMIWKRTIAASEVAADPSLAPVSFATRAIGPLMPQAPISLAAAHRVLVPGYRLEGAEDTEPCLIRARDLAGKSSDVALERNSGDLTLYNLVFDEHQVFAANGLPVESFLLSPTNLCRLEEDAMAELSEIFPDIDEDADAFSKPVYPVWDDAVSLTVA